MKTINDFCNDAFESLRKEDEELKTEMSKGENAEFNSSEWRGLGLFSTTKPIIKWIMLKNLAPIFKLWPDTKAGYQGTKMRLDLGILLDEYAGDSPDDSVPDTAVSFKWAGIRKDVKLNSLKSLKNDILKLSHNTLKNRYLMQLMITHNDKAVEGAFENINAFFGQKNNDISGKLIFHNCFVTDAGAEEKREYKFHVIVWKVGKRNEKI